MAWNNLTNEPLPMMRDQLNTEIPELEQGLGEKAATGHSHANYQALLEVNLDLLMRGILYTKAAPFSQSFTFSGDGAKTAYKIPRSSVQQQGWVRGGVSATVGGVAATGTYDVHTQTFTFGTAPATGTNNVAISSTDVVPYQGMAASGVYEVVYLPYDFYGTTSGTGGGTSSHQWAPASVKLPVGEAAINDDALLMDNLRPSGLPISVTTPFMSTPLFGFDANAVRPFSGMVIETRAKNDGTPRGMGLASMPQMPSGSFLAWRGVGLSTSVNRLTFAPFLVRDADGELLLGVAAEQVTSGSMEILPHFHFLRGAFDLFRLQGGPIVEA